MVHITRRLPPREIEDGVRRDAEVRELLPDPTQPRLETVATFPNVAQRALEQLHTVAPLVPFLRAQQNGIYIDHRADQTENVNQPFARLLGGGRIGRTNAYPPSRVRPGREPR
jgi:hypothetical protein